MKNIKKLSILIKNLKSTIRALGDKGLFNWMPDRQYLQLVYKSETGKKLNLDAPVTYNEKLQWLKINDRKPEYSVYVDKYAVRQHIKDTVGEEYLIPLIAVYDSVDEIDWNKLPKKFVLKCTHGSGCNIICRDKDKLDIQAAKIKLNKWMKKSWYWFGREWPYKNVTPRIVCEQYLKDESVTELTDYKFMCFNGKAKFILICLNRNSKSGLNLDFYDMNWNPMPFEWHYPNSGQKTNKPKNFDKMVEFSEIFSKNIPSLRVDFYEVDDKLYIGELTFSTASGYNEFTPESYDELFGSWLELPEKQL